MNVDITSADLNQSLLVAQLRRDALGPLEISDEQIQRAAHREMLFANSRVSTDRIAAINTLTLTYHRHQFPGSWAAHHLTERFGTNLASDQRFQPGYAPPGWDRLVTHLRARGVSDREMIAAGVAKRNEATGRVRDHFVNRLVLPIIHRRHGWDNFTIVPFAGPDMILGFVARRHPDLTDADRKGPKYLNSPTTALFSLGAQLYIPGTDLYEPHTYETGARPVLVEGPMDAIAVTLATHGTRIGVAPLGTSLTDEQAHQLAALRDHVGTGNTSGVDLDTTGFDPWLIVATDNDINLAGQVAAERDYWLLAPLDLDPGNTLLPAGLDPADMFTLRGPAALRDVLTHPDPLATTLLDERLTNLPPDHARTAASHVLATRPTRNWNNGATQIATRLQLNTAQAQRDLIPAANTWARNPRQAALTQLDQVGDVRARMQQAALQPPAQRWTGLGNELDPRLPHEPDWPALAQLLDQAHAEGHNVSAVTRHVVAERPQTEQPAQDPRYRLVATLDITINAGEAATTAPSAGAAKERQVAPNVSATPVSPRR